jgi:hypothetical protein
MRAISLTSVYLLAILGRTAIGQGPDAAIPIEDKGEYEAAYKLGRMEADQELKVGRATIYTYGLRNLFEYLDRKTGLPEKGIAGCVVDDTIMGRGAGHNARIAEYIKEHGLPSNSFKRWEKELFDLKTYYESRTEAERPHRLTRGDPALRSPDGRYTFRPVKTWFEKDDGRLTDTLGIAVGGDGIRHDVLTVLWDEGDTDFLWGPEGSGFAVVRCMWKEKPWYMALDLKRGRWLREQW